MRTARRSVFSVFGVLTAALTVVSLDATVYAMPLANGAAEVFPERVPSSAEFEAVGVDFTAIVALNNCSGSLIRFNTSRDTDKAVVLTNGHCYEGGFLQPGEVLTDKASSRTFRILNANGQGNGATLRAERLIYATMTSTDISLYRTNKTYAQIQDQFGVTALTLSDKRPQAGDPVRVVSGYWRKIYSCSITKFIPELREGNWTFRDSIKYSQPGCETIGGTSGSPIVNGDTREVIGVNNTGNEDGARCTVNNPCEVDKGGKVTVEKGASYGQETFQISTCLNAANAIDLDLRGCQLPRAKAVRLRVVAEE